MLRALLLSLKNRDQTRNGKNMRLELKAPNSSTSHDLSVAQLCGDGWSNVGEACLQINSSRESYDNAQHYCKNLEGNIASLTTAKQVDFVLEELQKYQQKGKVCVCSYVLFQSKFWTHILIPDQYFPHSRMIVKSSKL